MEGSTIISHGGRDYRVDVKQIVDYVIHYCIRAKLHNEPVVDDNDTIEELLSEIADYANLGITTLRMTISDRVKASPSLIINEPEFSAMVTELVPVSKKRKGIDNENNFIVVALTMHDDQVTRRSYYMCSTEDEAQKSVKVIEEFYNSFNVYNLTTIIDLTKPRYFEGSDLISMVEQVRDY